MQVFELKGELRTDLGKKATKVLREEKKVPCVLYGGKENIHFSVVEKDLSKLVYTPFVYIVKIMIDGNAYEAVMREIQFHPVTDRILHIDFYHIFAEKPVIIEVPVKLKGFAEGVQAGGKLVQVIRKLKVKALPANLPGEVELDVTSLGLGKSIKVKELSFDNFEVVNAKEVVIAQVKVTRASKSVEAGDKK
ncbi:50S ribosomal protein L25 [Odoribacter laneus]|jgi:ribosomal protein L25, ctc-form|uniref:Large ribosomal subunit protein bL25 n=1 Tax=Odoribacter laneus YIT 12061 TaxID=742817 RepID=H1DHH1_9BACT|nr:50S ribosomal protein L25/general stress protein Ctc [Odoribacter laneus]MBS1445819.1 50S ribosomal protein L25/general stress protein Ctc [Odoribacter sp.]EHP47854.1 ribosomal protein L25, Ctc-form [Odoribacter laneus YIT 12061]CCZ81852.1 50S ribosomal protein L25 [Odoribacter laneus CAG:561]GKI21850.1 50S ribosomal protein L25 [Odoribacter laneus]GKI26432.1 50S ribosomal protein L25 [Odoribacter laneus]